jgi:CheY-like chemotaxis protein
MPVLPRVLVVEDEPIIAAMVREWLEELGCEPVGPARSVANAIELITGAHLDAAIVDVSLGKEDCAPVAAMLRKEGVPFAFATGREIRGLVEIYEDALTLPKPYDFAAMRGVVTRMLNGHASAQ